MKKLQNILLKEKRSAKSKRNLRKRKKAKGRKAKKSLILVSTNTYPKKHLQNFLESVQAPKIVMQVSSLIISLVQTGRMRESLLKQFAIPSLKRTFT